MPIALIDQTNRLAWLRERMGGIGASDVPKILGLNTLYGSAMSVFAEKTLDPDYIEEEKTPLQEVGLMMESWLLEKTALDYNAIHHSLDGMLWQSDERAHVRCTRDGLLVMDEKRTATSTKSVELKTRAFDDWEGEVPPHVFAQVMTQAYVMGEKEIILGVCFRVSGERFFKTIPRDQSYIDEVILPACDSFWERVKARDPEGLEVDSSDWTLKAMAKLNPGVEGKDCVLGAEFDDLADELLAIRESVKAEEARKDEIRNKIAAAAKDAVVVILPSGRYFNYRQTNVKARPAEAYSYRTPLGPFGGNK